MIWRDYKEWMMHTTTLECTYFSQDLFYLADLCFSFCNKSLQFGFLSVCGSCYHGSLIVAEFRDEPGLIPSRMTSASLMLNLNPATFPNALILYRTLVKELLEWSYRKNVSSAYCPASCIQISQNKCPFLHDLL